MVVLYPKVCNPTPGCSGSNVFLYSVKNKQKKNLFMVGQNANSNFTDVNYWFIYWLVLLVSIPLYLTAHHQSKAFSLRCFPVYCSGLGNLRLSNVTFVCHNFPHPIFLSYFSLSLMHFPWSIAVWIHARMSFLYGGCWRMQTCRRSPEGGFQD